MARKSNITDVARAAGVSKATVSNYLNNRGRRFSAGTEERIRRVVEELRYIPDPGARGIKSREGGRSLGVVVRNSMDVAVTAAYFQQVLPVLCDELDANGYRALILPETSDRDRDIAYMRELAKGLIAGYFIFNIDEADDPYVQALEQDETTFLCLGYNRQIKNYVASRHDFGWEAATRHLQDAHGAKRVAAVPGKLSHTVAVDRMRGYRSALEAAGREYRGELIFPEDYVRGGGAEALAWLERLFSSGARLRPDAVLLPHCLLQGATDLLGRKGVAVPEEARLVVFDPPSDAEDGRYARIALRLPQIGREAVEKMLRLVKKSGGEGGVFLDVDFVPGRSCGCDDGTHGK